MYRKIIRKLLSCLWWSLFIIYLWTNFTWTMTEAAAGGVIWKKLFLVFLQIHRKTPVSLSLFFNKVSAVLKKRLQHRCFPVSFGKFCCNIFYTTPPGNCFWWFNPPIQDGLFRGCSRMGEVEKKPAP